MLNKWAEEKKIDLKKLLPGYVQDEELGEFIDVLSDVMNNMYAAKTKDSTQIYSKHDVTEIPTTEFDYENDVSPLMWSYGSGDYSENTSDANKPQPVPGKSGTYNSSTLRPGTPGYPGEWPYTTKATAPSGSQEHPLAGALTIKDSNLGPLFDYQPDGDGNIKSTLKPDWYTKSPANLDQYKNTVPPQGAPEDMSHPLYPNKVFGPGDLGKQFFDASVPKDIASSFYDTTEAFGTNYADPIYDNKGLYQDKSMFVSKKIPQFNSMYKSTNGRHVQKDHIGVLEKIYQLLDLHDAQTIDFEYLQYFADYLGYDLTLSLFDHNEALIATSVEAGYAMTEELIKDALNKQVRSVVQNLPYWYQMKGTESSIKILLYSFGLVAQIRNYYTKNYSANRNDWETAKSFYNTGFLKTGMNPINELQEDLSEIPDDWYPTPHFQVAYSLNESFSYRTDVFSNMEKFGEMIQSIESAKPIQDVFEGLVATFENKEKRLIFPYTSMVQRYITHTTMRDESFDITKKDRYYSIGKKSVELTYATEQHSSDITKKKIETDNVLPGNLIHQTTLDGYFNFKNGVVKNDVTMLVSQKPIDIAPDPGVDN